MFLADLWPSEAEIQGLAGHATDPARYRHLYADLFEGNAQWRAIASTTGPLYDWPLSTYIAQPSFLAKPEAVLQAICGARVLAIFGDSVTTDHISPAGAVQPDSPAGEWLASHGIAPADFNTYGARRGHFEVMMRGTFYNVRIKNLILPPRPDGRLDEGAYTLHQPSGQRISLFAASRAYLEEGVPLLVFAGEEYGTGSSRDWAAKGTRLLSVRAVIACSFERIHRSNLIGMGVLPLQFMADTNAQSLRLDGSERFDLLAVEHSVQPGQVLTLVIHRVDGSRAEASLLARLDNAVEAAYFHAGGILPFVLDQLLSHTNPPTCSTQGAIAQ